MAYGEKITMTGTVTDAFPGSKFEVTLDGKDIKVGCTISGKLRINQIRILKGDKVDVELSEYDLTKGRIIWRHK